MYFRDQRKIKMNMDASDVDICVLGMQL